METPGVDVCHWHWLPTAGCWLLEDTGSYPWGTPAVEGKPSKVTVKHNCSCIYALSSHSIAVSVVSVRLSDGWDRSLLPWVAMIPQGDKHTYTQCNPCQKSEKGKSPLAGSGIL